MPWRTRGTDLQIKKLTAQKTVEVRDLLTSWANKMALILSLLGVDLTLILD